MAVSTGAGPHYAWLTVNGAPFPIEHGSVTLHAHRESSSFNAAIPLSYPGAAATLANLSDNQATVQVSTRGVTGTLFTGEIDDADFDFIGRTIQVTGRDKSAKLHDNKASEKWVNKKPSDIVSDLIGRIGLSGNVTASTLMAGKQLEQDYVHLADNVSFGYIIHKLSQIDGCRWWVDPEGMFHYVPIGVAQGVYTITIDQDAQPISADCVQLQVRRNIQAGKTIATTVKSWHPKKKEVFNYTSNVEGNGGPVNYNYHIPTLLQDHVTKRAQSLGSEKARHEFTVTSTVVGDPTVRAGMGLSLSGTDYFDQTFDMDTVQHDFGMPGHLTHITARSAKQGRQPS